VWAGVALRLLEYFARRSLWIDEATVALSVGSRSPTELLTSGHRFSFLWIEWVATRLGGMNELALRVLPLAAGLALLPAFGRLASRLLEARVVWFAVALAALSPALVYYANEAKPYGIDALVAVVLTGCAFDVLDTRGSRRAWLRLILASGLALLISIPAAFLVTGIGLALATAPQLRRQPGALWRLALAGTLFAAVLGTLYVARYRSTAGDPSMRWWWEGGFLTPRSPDFFNRIWWAAQTAMGEHFVGGRPEPAAVVLAATLFLVGLVAIGRRRGLTTLLVLAGPIVVVVAASAVEAYSIAPRTILFAIPMTIIALAAGMAWLADRLPRSGRTAALALSGVAWLTPAFGADVDRIALPQLPEAARPVIDEFNRLHRGNEPVYIFGHGVPAWLFYTTDWTAPDTLRLRRLSQRASYPYRGRCELISVPPGLEWRLVTGYARVARDPGWADGEAGRIKTMAQPFIWLFFSHFAPEERTALLSAVQRAGGHPVYVFQDDGAELYRYRFPLASAGSAPRRASEAQHAESAGSPCDNGLPPP
jgi:hypothetical protein